MLGYKIIAIIEIKHLTLFLIFISLSSVLSKVCHPNNKNLPLGKFHVIHYHIDTGLHQDFHHIHIYNKYSKNVRISAIFDKGMILPYKASPIDRGPQIFEKLLNERIIPYE